MKQTFRTILVAAMAMAMVAFAGCTKESTDNTWGSNMEPPTQGDWVDLGLESGLLWASCNVGATTPEGYGDFFAWGETSPKDIYSWSTYRYCTVTENGELSTLTKYNYDTYWGTVDTLTTLLPADDAATARLGNDARTPNEDEWNELLNNTSMERTTLNGVNGLKFTGPNGNTIFLPAAGCREKTEYVAAGYCGEYWSASLSLEYESLFAAFLQFTSYSHELFSVGHRYTGISIRAVRNKQN